jgi:hypothetical protein
MKETIIVVIVFIAGFVLGQIVATTKPAAVEPVKQPDRPINEFELLLNAIELQESGGDHNASGDGGNAVGSFQIWKIMVDDVNRIIVKSDEGQFTYADRYDSGYSRRMCRIYLDHYCKTMTYEQMARCWNGGPTGYKKPSTLQYGKDVMEIMKGMK